MPADDDRLRAGLSGLAADIAVDDSEHVLDGVYAARRRRRRRHTASAGVAIVALLAGGVATLAAVDGSSGDDVLRSSSPSTTAGPPTATTDAPIPTPAAGPVSTDAMTVPDGGPATDPPDTRVGGEQPPDPPEIVVSPDRAHWLVPWQGGFLAGSTDASGEPVAGFSRDGVSWTAVDMTPPPGVAFVADVVAAGDRLVVLGSVEPETSSILVASSSDLANWETSTVAIPRPTDLPDGVQFGISPVALAANGSGWVATVGISEVVRFESYLPADVLERSANSAFGVAEDGGGLTVHRRDAGGDVERLDFTFAELGVPDELVPYIMNPVAGRAELWAAPFGGTPARSEPASFFPPEVVALDDRFVQLSPEIRSSPDGLTWTDAEHPLTDRFVTQITSTGDGLVVYLLGDPELDAYLVDASLSDWKPVDLPGVPEQASSLTNDPSVAAIVVDSSLPITEPSSLTVDLAGFRLVRTWVGSVATYELVDIATGAVLLLETVDVGNLEQIPETGPFEHLTTSPQGDLIFTDPASGEVLVVFTRALLDDALEEAFARLDEALPERRPDRWLIAYGGDGRWLVEDLDDTAASDVVVLDAVKVAMNGDAVLLGIDGRWSFHRLPG